MDSLSNSCWQKYSNQSTNSGDRAGNNKRPVSEWVYEIHLIIYREGELLKIFSFFIMFLIGGFILKNHSCIISCLSKIRFVVYKSSMIISIINYYTYFSTFLVAKLLYKYKCPSVCPYVNHVQGETWFSRPLIEIELDFFVQNPLINEHLFCEYLVRQSVGHAKKCRNLKIKKHVFLGGYLR